MTLSSVSTFQDIHLACEQCSGTFLFSISEQEFFQKKGLFNLPKRCADCRVIQRLRRKNQDISVITEITCHGCGIPAKVPFRPQGHSPVYCNNCYMTRPKTESPIALVSLSAVASTK